MQLVGIAGDELEAGVGVEPTHRSFADSRLTTWLTRPPANGETVTRGTTHCQNLLR
jgi:hypothetical protein